MRYASRYTLVARFVTLSLHSRQVPSQQSERCRERAARRNCGGVRRRATPTLRPLYGRARTPTLRPRYVAPALRACYELRYEHYELETSYEHVACSELVPVCVAGSYRYERS